MAENPIIIKYKTFLRVEKYLKLQTINNYCFEIKKFVEWVNYIDALCDFEKINFNDYLFFRYKNKKYTKNYTNKILQYLISFYSFLEKTGIIISNPALKLQKAEGEKKIPTILYLYEIDLLQKQFTNSIKDLRDNALIELLLSTGLRINEALSLTLFDYKNKNYSVLCKGDFERLIIINEFAVKKIENYLSNRNLTSNYVFCNTKGLKITNSYFNKMLKNKCKIACINKKISAHTFRHTYASLLYEGGLNLIEIKSLMGHQNIASTEIYTKINVEHLRKEMRCHPRW